MTTVPAQMTDRWHDREEPGPGEGDLYWHMLMNDHPQVVDLARDAQQRLARFPGLHMTPLERLHMTAMLAGPAGDFSPDQLRQMITIASARLAGTPAVTVTVGGIVYHREAIMLAVKPKRALASIHDAVQAATRAVTGGHVPDGDSQRTQTLALSMATWGNPRPESGMSVGAARMAHLWDFCGAAPKVFGGSGGGDIGTLADADAVRFGVPGVEAAKSNSCWRNQFAGCPVAGSNLP